ncbi:bifunctional lysylphosphatidylglycerol flippase/synthetase MprF [Arthrobacter sp. Z1-15]
MRILSWQAHLLRGSARLGPVTLAFTAFFWVAGIVSQSLVSGPSGPLQDWVVLSSRSLPEYWPALLLSGFWASGPSGYVAATLLILLVVLPCERVLGSAKLAAAAVSAQVLGALFAVGFTHAANTIPGDWSLALESESFVGPLAMVCGVATAASARFPTLWRRRLRVGLFTLLVLLALYGGSFHSVTVLGAAVTGALAGPLLAGRLPAFPGQLTATRREARVLVALVVAASAAGPVISALSAQAVGPLAVLRFLNTDIQLVDPQTLAALCSDPGQSADCGEAGLRLRAGPAGFFLATLPQVLLIVLADGLRRGRHFAWWGAVVLQGLMTVLAAVRTVRYAGAEDPGGGYNLGAAQGALALFLPVLVPLAVFVLLCAARGLFTVSAAPGTYRRFWVRVAGAAALLSAVYVLAGLALRSSFTPQATAQALIADLPERFLPVLELELPRSTPGLLPRTVPADLLYEGIGLLFWVLVCLLLLGSFWEPAYRRDTSDSERARTLLKTHGGGTMAWMTLWPGNTYWFSSSGNSYFAFRPNLGVALTVGPPVGPRTELRSTVEEFSAYCTANGSAACFYSVDEEVETITAGMGFSRLQVAEETILPLGNLEFRGKKFQDARTALNHARKAGIEARWISYSTAPLAVLDQLHAISEEWVADKKMPEMGFTLGGLDEMEDPEVRCLIAVDSDGTVHAVTSWLPIYRDGQVVGWTLDFMRRRSSGFRPAMDFLIASAARMLQDEGYEVLSLSGAPLARARPASRPETDPADGSGRGPGDGDSSILDSVLDVLGTTLEPVYGFRSLLAFKAKFQPRYVPLYMTYRDPASLPAIGNAVARAYLPKISLAQGLSLVRNIVDGSR